MSETLDDGDDNARPLTAGEFRAGGATVRAELVAAREAVAAEQVVTSERIDALLLASQAQTTASERLATAVIEQQERARLARRRFRVTMTALASATVAILTAIFVVLAQVYVTVDSGKKTRGTLLDCVQPTGKCYQQGQARTAQVVGSLNRVTTLAAACAPDYVGLPLSKRIVAIENCIRRGLGK